MFRHFATIAEAGEVPLRIYNNPGTAKFAFGVDLSWCPAELLNVAAVKMTLPADWNYTGELARLRARTLADFSVGYSGDWGAADALLAGCDAWYSVVARLLPEPALALTRFVQSDHVAEAKRLDDAFRSLWDLFRICGSFGVMYAIADAVGLGAGVPSLPILPADDCRRVAAVVRRLDTIQARADGADGRA